MTAARGALIAFGTAPGSIAEDGDPGRNGVFTGHLAETLKVRGLTLDQVFNTVRAKSRSSDRGQADSLGGNKRYRRFLFQSG